MRGNRRRFLGQCTSMLGMLALARPAGASGDLRHYPNVQLVDRNDRPLKADALTPRKEYVFHYPYVSTPCFLIDLGGSVDGGEELETEDGERYRWEGGVGPNRSLVAFSAICAHRLSHPTSRISFIAYRPEEVGFMSSETQLSRRAGVIQCCSEQSVYDPTRGAEVIGGPAPQPLASIRLEVSHEGAISASGVYGGRLFDKYFELFSSRLVLEYETFEVDTLIHGTTAVVPGEEFSNSIVRCG